MKVISQVIDRKIQNQEVLRKERKFQLAYEEHISVYMLCLAYLGLTDNSIRKKKKLWKRYLESQSEEEREKIMVKLNKYKSKEEKIIVQAMDKLSGEIEKSSQRYGSLFGEYVWAILSFEHEQED